MSQNDLVPLAVYARNRQLTLRWLRDRADRGEIPCLRADGRYLVSVAAVDAVLQKMARQAAKPEPEQK